MIVTEKKVSYDKIRKMAYDVWALISDPVYSDKDGSLKSGILVYFSKNKEDVQQFILRDKKGMIKNYTILCTGKIPSDQVFVL